MRRRSCTYPLDGACKQLRGAPNATSNRRTSSRAAWRGTQPARGKPRLIDRAKPTFGAEQGVIAIAVLLTPDHHLRRGIVLIVAAVFMFSAMDTLAKFMLLSDYPVGALIWARYTVHLVVTVALLWPRMRSKLFLAAQPGLQLLRGVLLVASTLCFYMALRHLPLAEAAAISFLGPVLTTLLAGWLLHEKASTRQWFAVLLGFTGVLIIIRPGGALFTPAAVFPLLTAILFSIYQVVTRKMSGRDHAYTTLFYTALIGGILTSMLLPLNWQTPNPLQVLMMCGMGVLGGYGHYLLIRAVENASPVALAPFSYSQLVWSTLLGYLAFRDFPDGGSFLGMAVVVLAGLLALNWKQMRAGATALPERAEKQERTEHAEEQEPTEQEREEHAERRAN